MCSQAQTGYCGQGAGRPRPPKFFKIIGLLEIFILPHKIIRLLLLVLNFIGKSLNLAPTFRCQVNGGGLINRGLEKIQKSNKWGVKINGGVGI